MRRAKPKEKREIKINEKKEIPVIRDIQIPKELENAFIFTACMLEMKACLEEHREIWKKEFKNGGYLKANYKIALGRMINLCDMLSKKYTENGIKMSDFARIKIIKMIESIHMEKNIRDKTRKETRVMSYEDEYFPEYKEFLNTILAAWTYSMILFTKLHHFIRKEKIEKEAKELSDKVILFMTMIDEEIVLSEHEIVTKAERKKYLKPVSEKKLQIIHTKLKEKGYLKD
ncbi:hypothetical protein FSBG_00161 [Fusobacterium gonidiaformans 3-1-5R]|uniref:Uncharacterized protein n=1 Tax=Fusobacterium gonidiaformans 3-1-5R TaxID=469605 RepID=E5BEY3_9FUSO|nr:hypothetical protein [Fusobacterium gonidiaformans]EFS20664.1 hypothetical protein FSBG_00161 [Fusobacterium gonidiaformans 3-1-5R]